MIRGDDRMPVASADECGCAPSPAEARALWPGAPISRRTAMVAGALGLTALGAFGLGATALPAFANTYPTWDDVEKARANEAAKAREITRIEGLIRSLAVRVEEANRLAQEAGDAYYVAQQEFMDAAERASLLQEQADEQAQKAVEMAHKAGQIANQIYRNGGDDTALELFFAGSAVSADELLSRLGQMDKLLGHNRALYDSAIAARNSAQQLSDQAAAARDERDRLQKIAEEKLLLAQAAADAAQAALDEQRAHMVTLEAQLAALKDATAETIAGYEEGVEEARRLEEERRRREAEQAGSGGQVSPGGWARPHSGWLSYLYGPRAPICVGGSCSSSVHRGIDIVAACGTYIFAAASGQVDAAFYNGGYGNYIRIQHAGGVATHYAHIRPEGFLVSHGQVVGAGQAIAYSGTTGISLGCHLHFEVSVNNVWTDPLLFLRERGVSI